MDLIETYKIITVKLDMDPGKFFEAARDARTRGHQYKLFKRPSGRIFIARVVDTCASTVPAKLISTPKYSINNYIVILNLLKLLSQQIYLHVHRISIFMVCVFGHIDLKLLVR